MEIADIWSATMRLRFAEREHPYNSNQKFHVLQQLWATRAGKTEWRDVPLEKEETK